MWKISLFWAIFWWSVRQARCDPPQTAMLFCSRELIGQWAVFLYPVISIWNIRLAVQHKLPCRFTLVRSEALVLKNPKLFWKPVSHWLPKQRHTLYVHAQPKLFRHWCHCFFSPKCLYLLVSLHQQENIIFMFNISYQLKIKKSLHKNVWKCLPHCVFAILIWIVGYAIQQMP